MIFAQPQDQSRLKLRAFVRGTPFQLRVAGAPARAGRLAHSLGGDRFSERVARGR